MKREILIAATILAIDQASAGVRIESVTRDIQTHAVDGGADVVLVQDSSVRSTHANSSASTIIIKDGSFYELDGEKKTYYVMDEKAMKKATDEAATAMTQMQQRVKNMPPQQRAMMEQSMGKQMPGVFGKKDIFELKDTGKTESVDGRECHLWNLHKNGAIYNELCVVPFGSLPGKEDVDKAFKDLSRFFVTMAAGLTSAGDYFAARDSVGGYPVRLRSFDEAGQLRPSEIVLTKWVEEPLPASTFAVPDGYKKIAPPKAGN